jgi:hypothetical protein
MKKIFLVSLLAALTFFRASAQVNVELSLEQDQFLPGEAVKVAVKISNRSGQIVHLGATPDWLTFSVESVDGFVVNKSSEVPMPGAFDLESSQLGIKRVDIQPYFGIVRPGRYKIIATLRMKDWKLVVSSLPKNFDVINGVELWSQDFGVPVTNGAPEIRKYALEEANYLRTQLQLYARVTDAPESKVLKITALGSLVSFSQPDAQIDRYSRLHVLWQAGSQAFDYTIMNADGLVVRREIYDYIGSRPRLAIQDDGTIVVAGGVRRPQATDQEQKPAEENIAPPVK